MSSLGDIVQAFSILDWLRATFPEAKIDWATEEAFVPLVAAHPYVRQALSVNLKEMKRGWRSWRGWRKCFRFFTALRRERYDVLFDLQGNCKSGFVTFVSKACLKVGLGIQSVREKPNVLFTNFRFEVSKEKNIREQYIELVRTFFQTQNIRLQEPLNQEKVKFRIDPEEKEQIRNIFLSPVLQTPLKIMVCPGSQWINKQVPVPILCQFLQALQKRLSTSFLLVWGSEEEKKYCERVQSQFPICSLILEKLPITVWQNVMHEVDVVLAVDSSALHLCGMTNTFSFSVFGPTSPAIFKPIGSRHFAIQGACPYGKTFEKTCPQLRTCPTGACMGRLDPQEMAKAFFLWWDHHFRE